MGLGGFHMHSRTGLATEYLRDEFMDMVKACCDKAEAENMLAWLYDEDRWSSGPAGGKVTKIKRKKSTVLTRYIENFRIKRKKDLLIKQKREKEQDYMTAMRKLQKNSAPKAEKTAAAMKKTTHPIKQPANKSQEKQNKAGKKK